MKNKILSCQDKLKQATLNNAFLIAALYKIASMRHTQPIQDAIMLAKAALKRK